MSRPFGVWLLAFGVVSGLSLAAVSAQQPPAPQPFPRSGNPAPPTAAPAPPPQAPAVAPPVPTSPGAPASAPAGPPTDASVGVPGVVFQNSEYLGSFDIGRGQRCYLLGTTATYAEVVGYYKQALRDNGRELVKAPPMQQFDIGKFQDQTMSYPPSVVVKDYTYGNGEGYLQVSGTTRKRYPTVIQIVPVPGR